jgi:hypothetical protein
MSPFGACHGLGTSSADVNLQARAVSGNYTLGYWFLIDIKFGISQNRSG